MSKIVIDSEERMSDIVFGDDEQFEFISQKDIAELRWSMVVEVIVKNVEDGKFYRGTWNRAATEMQDHEFYDTTLVEVERKVRIVEQVYYEEVTD